MSSSRNNKCQADIIFSVITNVTDVKDNILLLRLHNKDWFSRTTFSERNFLNHLLEWLLFKYDPDYVTRPRNGELNEMH